MKTGWWDRRFWIVLNSPDGNSGRTLKLILRPAKNPFGGINLWSWRKGESSRLEKFFSERGVIPAW